MTSGGGSGAMRQRAIQELMKGRTAEGIAILEKALAASPASGELHLDLGTAHWQNGDPARAGSHYMQAAKLAPQNPFVLNGYGTFLLQQGKLEAAEPLLTQAFALKPDYYEIPNNLGLLQYRRGRLAEAEKLFLRSLRSNPAWANAHANLGDVLKDTKRYALAEKAYLHALKLNGNYAPAWFRLADVYIALSREDEAIDCLRRAVKLDPAQREPWQRLIGLLELKNRLEEAFQAVEDAKKHVEHIYLALSEAKLLHRRGKIAEATAILERYRALMLEQPPRLATAGFFFELGQLHDRADNSGKAFEAFVIANGLQDKVEGSPVKKQRCRDSIAHCKLSFAPSLAQNSCPLPALPGQRSPVFLLGFPRSGTTLLGQILSSHPGLFVAEEKAGIDKAIWNFIATFGQKHQAAVLAAAAASGEPPWLMSNPCYPCDLDKLRTEDIERMRRIFYEQDSAGQDSDAAGSRVFVDINPLNTLHAGFIKRLFPDAKFILALRHPCDAVLSCFMQEFVPSPYMQRFLDLEDAAHFYHEVFSLWDHYKNIFGLDVHVIHYEDVVADFQPTIAALLKFLGVEWTDAVFEYDKTALKKSRIQTPSYHQVTQKLYTRASGRWQRYRKHLEPVLPILEPHALKHGYSMDPAGVQE